MKKLLIALMCVVSFVMLSACGGDSKKDNVVADENVEVKEEPRVGENVEIKDINADNWTEVVAANFGLELSQPEGWSVKTAKSHNGVNNVEIVLNVGGTATYASFGDAVFAELKKDASSDIKKYGGTNVYTTFAEAAGASGIASFTADVDGESGKSVTVNYFNNGTTVQLSLMRLGKW